MNNINEKLKNALLTYALFKIYKVNIQGYDLTHACFEDTDIIANMPTFDSEESAKLFFSKFVKLDLSNSAVVVSAFQDYVNEPFPDPPPRSKSQQDKMGILHPPIKGNLQDNESIN
jgi:hypothetical protein